ncbi:hypothetical protein BDZ89DRAFT_1068215 [Hymenopellis radicata]|nr:hypothetical protein BDZ89DRAFT_1068215 [Hymenopellis radicata]
MSSSATYKGSCHCGKISFSATISAPLESGHEVISCNCSVCARNGYLFVYLKDDAIKFHSGEGEGRNYGNLLFLSYTFGQGRLVHDFCPKCGTSIFGTSMLPGAFEGMKGINVRTFDHVDLNSLTLKKVDGKGL